MDSGRGGLCKIEDESYLPFRTGRNEFTLSNLSLYYDFYRHGFMKKCGIERLKVSAYANNLFTLSSIEIERGTSYPFSRSFNFSVSATF